MIPFWKTTVLSVVILFSNQHVAPATAQNELPTGVNKIDFHGYKDCFEISNATARVVLGHHRGGRVLAYERDGKNVLFLRDESDWSLDKEGMSGQLSAGRFDVGPEQMQARGDDLWKGEWTAKATGDREVTMQSVVDSKSGLQVERKFVLHESSSRLTVTQTVSNKGDQSVRQCFWSRTLAVHGGVAIVPCDSSRSLMPNLYCMALNGKLLNVRPEDPMVRRVDDFLIIDGPPEHAKLGMDSVKGWVAYQTREDQLFVKRYPVSDIGQYGELAGYNLSVWYPKKTFLDACEVEPIGPMKNLRPRESDSFTVDWWLLERAFPSDGKVDPVAVEADVNEKCVLDS